MTSRIGRFARIDWTFLLAALGATGLGLFYLSSASPTAFGAQIKWVAPAVLGFCMALSIGYWRLVPASPVLYAGVLSLLVLVLGLPARRGAHSWIDLPGFSIQPSEMAKIAIVLVLAHVLANNHKQVFTLRGLVAPVLLGMIPTALILKQPDLGSAMILPPTLFIMLFASGARKTHLACALVIGVLLVIPMWTHVMKDYQKRRIEAFIQPERYEAQEAYQLIMSLIAIGSGGVSGKGWQEGTYNTLGLLPDRHTDFIFGVIAEEGGFIRAGLLILMYLLLALCGLNIAAQTEDPVGRLVAVGGTSLICVQAFINIAVVTALLPTTGITLPLVSYGGSSLLASFIIIGLVMSVQLKPRPMFGYRESFRGREGAHEREEETNA